jgi:hypothetical protein
VRTLLVLSEKISSFYKIENGHAAAPALALLCLLAVWRGSARAVRFSEICIFVLFGSMLLSLIGSGGEGLWFDFSEGLIFSAFDVIGAWSVFFSLYLRNVTPESGKMSDFAKNSAFAPSPFSAGILAAGVSLLLYAFFGFMGHENIIISLGVCFFALARLLLFAFSFSDMTAYPENGEGARRTCLVSAFCAFWAIFASFYPNAAKTAGIFVSALFPCAVFALSVFAAMRRKKEEGGF